MMMMIYTYIHIILVSQILYTIFTSLGIKLGQTPPDTAGSSLGIPAPNRRTDGWHGESERRAWRRPAAMVPHIWLFASGNFLHSYIENDGDLKTFKP